MIMTFLIMQGGTLLQNLSKYDFKTSDAEWFISAQTLWIYEV